MTFLSQHPHSQRLPQSLELTQQSFDEALLAFTPASLKGAGLFESSVAWGDIGGLDEVRLELKKTLEWPSKVRPPFQSFLKLFPYLIRILNCFVFDY